MRFYWLPVALRARVVRFAGPDRLLQRGRFDAGSLRCEKIERPVASPVPGCWIPPAWAWLRFRHERNGFLYRKSAPVVRDLCRGRLSRQIPILLDNLYLKYRLMSIKFYIKSKCILGLTVINQYTLTIINCIKEYFYSMIEYCFTTSYFPDILSYFNKIVTSSVQIRMVDGSCSVDASRSSYVGNWFFAGCK